MKNYSILSVLLLLFLIPEQILAQHRDTLYVVEEEPVYDTLFVHDTLRTYDTVAVNDHAGNADSPEFYKFSVGLSYCALGGGPTIKYGISKNCVFQTDFTGKYFINYMPSYNFAIFMNEVSQNFLFQHKFKEKNGVSYYYMIGGGVSGGMSLLRPYIWKIGAYPFFGMEFLMKNKKLSFQIDIRPGYGLLLKSANAKPAPDYPLRPTLALLFYLNSPDQYPYHGYDISVNFAVRFCKIK